MGCSSSIQSDLVTKRNMDFTTEPTPKISSSAPVDELQDTTKDRSVEKDEKGDNQDHHEDGEQEKTDKSVVKELTPEQIDEMASTALDQLKENLVNMKNAESIKEEDGYYNKAVRNNIRLMSSVYFLLKKNADIARNREFRRQLGNLILECGALDIVTACIEDIYLSGWANKEKETDLNKWEPLRSGMLAIANYTDDNDDFAIAMTNVPGFMEVVRKMLVDSAAIYFDPGKTLPETRGFVICLALTIVHNSSKRESNIMRLRALNFTEVLIPYLNSTDKSNVLISLASLAGIINEAESHIIQGNSQSLKYVLTVLKKSLTTDEHEHEGWSSEELGQTVRELARNDANKKLLVECGALEHLVKLARIGDVGEKREAVGAIWALSFDEDNQKRMVEDEELDVVGVLMEMMKFDDIKVKQGCNGTLWSLREQLQQSDKYRDISKRILTQSVCSAVRRRTSIVDDDGIVKEQEQETDDTGHIMISYQWSNQATMIQLRDVLRANGFKVWLDLDNMGGSTVQAMAEAVENSKVVLMCMSNKYKISPNCRAEAEYAFQLRKTIVPLLLEPGYKADGWLGLILGAKLYYEFTDKYPFNDKAKALVKELKTIYERKDEAVLVPVVAKTVTTASAPRDEPDTGHAVAMVTPSAGHLVPRAKLQQIRNWKQDDVTKWVEKYKLTMKNVRSMTGGEVAMLAAMKREAPEFFYKYLQDMLKVTSLLEMSRLVWALEDLILQ